MKTRLCLIALALAAAFGAHAQDSATPPPDGQGMHGQQRRPPDPQERAQKLAKHLDLNAQQQAQVLAILQTQQQKMQALRSGGARGPDRRDQAKAIMAKPDHTGLPRSPIPSATPPPTIRAVRRRCGHG